MLKQAINEQRQRNTRENTLMNCIYNQMNSKKPAGNSNEIRPLPTRNEGAASGEGIPNKLYNKISENGVCENGFRYKSKIETPHGTIYFSDDKDIALYGEDLLFGEAKC